MKILFTVHQFFPESRAGVEVVTLGLAKELRRRGHEPFVLAAKRSTPGDGIRPGEIENYDYEGIPVRKIGRPEEGLSRPFHLNYRNEAMEQRASEYAREVRPDIVHAMHLQGLSASVLSAFRELGLPVIYTAADFWTICPVVDLRRHDGAMCRGPEVHHCVRCIASRSTDARVRRTASTVPGAAVKATDLFSRTPLARSSLLLRQVRDVSERPGYIRERMKSVDHVLAYTHLARNLLSKNGVGAGKTSVSSYGIDTSGVAGARTERQACATLRVGFVGTLAPHKGPDTLVRAFKAAPDLDARLDIYGDPERYAAYAEELRSLAADDGRISLHGLFSRGELGRVYSEIDVLVVPSRWYENGPGVIFESFAAGAPVVATDLGGMSEFVRHGENGLLFRPEDAGDLARQLRRLCEEPGVLERLREGIGDVKTVGEYAAELERLYDTLLSERSGN